MDHVHVQLSPGHHHLGRKQLIQISPDMRESCRVASGNPERWFEKRIRIKMKNEEWRTKNEKWKSYFLPMTSKRCSIYSTTRIIPCAPPEASTKQILTNPLGGKNEGWINSGKSQTMGAMILLMGCRKNGRLSLCTCWDGRFLLLMKPLTDIEQQGTARNSEEKQAMT